jgi:tRNA dimethylallyltransferase
VGRFEPRRALVGPTASGKTTVGIRLALGCEGEIVSVDSMLVYRGMDVGTAKPTPRERGLVHHHLLDLVDPSEPFSVVRFQDEGLKVMAELDRTSRPMLLVGGSGLYFRALVDRLRFPGTDSGTRRQLEREASIVGAARMHERLRGLDPRGAEKIEPANVRRIVRALEVAAVTGRPFSGFADAWNRYPADGVLAAGISIERKALDARIRMRVHRMLERGWLEEVDGLVASGFGGWLTATQAIGYAELARHLEGSLSLEEALDRTIVRTRNLARRQMAWFRRDPRIRWFEAGEGGAEEVEDQVSAYLGIP